RNPIHPSASSSAVTPKSKLLGTMKSSPSIKITAALAMIMTYPAALDAQTIGIRVGDSVHVDIETIPTQQFWLTGSSDLAAWTKHTFVDHSTTLDLGPPASGSRFFKLDPLYGQLSWSAADNMPVARDQFTGGVIDGKLYLFGGNGNPDGVNLSRLDIYDLKTGEWTRGADYDFGIEELSSAVVGGKLYVFGGYAGGPTRINLCYDPGSDTWSETAPKPTQIQWATVVAWGEKILVLGGDQGDDLGSVTVIEAYDTTDNTWEELTNLADPSEHFGAGVHEDILYLVGGGISESLTIHNGVLRFDLKNGLWLPEMNDLLSHPIVATYSSACPIVNGKLIIGGGLTTADGSFTVTDIESDLVGSDQITVYDIENNTFSHNAPLPESFNSHLFLLAGDKLLSLGGKIAPGSDVLTSRMIIGTFSK
ncbi:MAG: hypothetical protein NTW21_35850, partial [Verrucomicrobia bacterium]|nr:hypothetical protein [Verrucomicrobiota bacterium]